MGRVGFVRMVPAGLPGLTCIKGCETSLFALVAFCSKFLMNLKFWAANVFSKDYRANRKWHEFSVLKNIL